MVVVGCIFHYSSVTNPPHQQCSQRSCVGISSIDLALLPSILNFLHFFLHAPLCALREHKYSVPAVLSFGNTCHECKFSRDGAQTENTCFAQLSHQREDVRSAGAVPRTLTICSDRNASVCASAPCQALCYTLHLHCVDVSGWTGQVSTGLD